MADMGEMLERKTAAILLKDGERASAGYLRSGRGEPLVLLHGVGMNAGVWKPQISRLKHRFDVIAVDLLGHGSSSLPPEDPELSDYAQHVLGLLDHIGIDCVFLVGHSMGALVAQEIALTAPERVRKLVSMNAVFQRSPEQSAAVQARAQHAAPSRDEQGVDATIARWFGDRVPLPFAEAAAIARSALQDVDPEGYARTYRLFARADQAHAERLHQLAMPALFMTGEHDPNSLPAMSAAMARRAPQGSFCIVPGERHMMAMTAPEAVTEAMVSFFTGAPDQVSGEQVVTGAGDLTERPIDPTELRRALGGFLTGVTVVTTLDENGVPRGFTANSFTSVSLDPPLVLVCIARQVSSYDAFAKGKAFAVNVLADHQKAVSQAFASRTADRFATVNWRHGSTSSPIIEGTVASFDCELEQLVEAGDHAILLGRVREFTHCDAQPLGYCRGAYISPALSQDALADASPDMVVGAILEEGECVLFLKQHDGSYSLPTGRGLGRPDVPGSLRGALAAAGIEARLDFIFAMWDEDQPAPRAHVYYRGVVSAPPASCHMIPLDDIPALPIADRTVASMLARYVRERRQDMFGIYVGTAVAGEVRRLADG